MNKTIAKRIYTKLATVIFYQSMEKQQLKTRAKQKQKTKKAA